MIHDVDQTLQRLLAAELARIPGCPVHDGDQITFDPPVIAEAVQDGEAHVNLYLHDIREDVERRDDAFHLVRRPEEGVAGWRRPAVQVKLGYLVTVYAGDDPPTEHRLLGDVLGVFLRYLAVPEEYLAGILEGLGGNAVLLSVAQPEHVANADPATLWQALGGRLRPALSLVATAPFDPFETQWTKAVREAVVAFGPGSDPRGPRRPLGNSFRVSAAGLVADQESAEPLAGAEVSVEGGSETAMTDGRGLFYLLNLPPGPYTLRVRKWGYREQEVQAVAPPSGRAEQLDPAVVALRRLSDAEWAAAAAMRAESAWNASGLVEAERAYRVSLSGRLCYPDGRPAAYLPVRVGRQRAQTDADGLYFFIDLPPGEHTVLAEVPGRGEVEIVARDGGGVVALSEEATTGAAVSRPREGTNA